MPKRIAIEEFHVTVRVPRGLSNVEADAMRQTLTDAAFEARLLRAIRRVFRREAALSKARVHLSR